MDFTKPKMTRESELKFTPYAWAKLLHMRDAGDSEVGGYGITGTDDPLLVTDFMLLKQECTSVTVELDEDDSKEFAERMMDAGIAPWQCQNIWIHTHPGNDATPSGVDEDNFDTNFSHPHWAIFFILAKGGDTYCRVRHNVGPGIDIDISSGIDWETEFPATDSEKWDKEYKDKVTIEKFVFQKSTILGNAVDTDGLGHEDAFTEFYTQYEGDKHSGLAGNLWDDEDDDPDVYMEADGSVHYYDETTESYYEYTLEGNFIDTEATMVAEAIVYYDPDVEPKWMNRVREWADNERKVVSQEIELTNQEELIKEAVDGNTES